MTLWPYTQVDSDEGKGLARRFGTRRGFLPAEIPAALAATSYCTGLECPSLKTNTRS